MADPGSDRSPEIHLMDNMFREKWLTEKMLVTSAENTQLKSKVDELVVDAEKSQLNQNEMIWFYRKENEQKEKSITNLTQTNQKLEQALRETKDKTEDELKRMENQNAAVKKELQEHLEKLTRESKSLREFREQKKELEMELAYLKTTNENEKKEMGRKMNDLERLNVAEKERLKREMLKKIKETKLNLLAMTEDQLHTTTKRAIMENEHMTIELQYQSKETERILVRNAKLQKEKQALKRELELHKETEAMLASRTSFFQKLIKKLHAKSKSDDRRIGELETSERASARTSNRNMFVENQVIRQLEARLDSAEQERLSSQAEAEVAVAQGREARDRLDHFLSLQDESITFIWSEVERARQSARKDGGRSLHDMTGAERDQFLSTIYSRLQVLRNSFARDIYSAFDGGAVDDQNSAQEDQPELRTD